MSSNRKETSEKPSLRSRRAMIEATAGLHMSARTPVMVPNHSGLMKIIYAWRPPEITTTSVK
jgi:hypothetical protein